MSLRALLRSPRPAVQRVGLAGLALCAMGCACPDATTVLPIDAGRHQSLLARYGSEALPDYECERLCPLQSDEPTTCAGNAGVGGGSSSEGGHGGSGGVGGAGGGAGTGGATGTAGSGATPCTEQPAFAYLDECKLATIEWTTPAVICTGTPPCM